MSESSRHSHQFKKSAKHTDSIEEVAMDPEKQRDPIPQSPRQPIKETPQKQPQKNEPLRKTPSEIEQVEIDFPLDSPPEPRPRWRR